MSSTRMTWNWLSADAGKAAFMPPWMLAFARSPGRGEQGGRPKGAPAGGGTIKYIIEKTIFVIFFLDIDNKICYNFFYPMLDGFILKGNLYDK